MPKNQVTDLITDQEMTFARLLLAGTMTDREAAQAAGLNPDTAAYTKAKPRVRTYMLEHRAALQQQLAQQEADKLRRQAITRERVLARLWELADLSQELTRNSISGQVKALFMIVAIEELVPNRRVPEKTSQQKSSPEPALKPNIYRAPWLPKRDEEGAIIQPPTAPLQEEPTIPEAAPTPAPAVTSSEDSEYNFAQLSESLSPKEIDPNSAFSTKTVQPYVRRYGPF
jgi:hypothetical protein